MVHKRQLKSEMIIDQYKNLSLALIKVPVHHYKTLMLHTPVCPVEYPYFINAIRAINHIPESINWTN